MKCPMCSHENAQREFDKHKSLSSFRSLEHQTVSVMKFIRSRSLADKICDTHLKCDVVKWLDAFFISYDKLKAGIQVKVVRSAVQARF